MAHGLETIDTAPTPVPFAALKLDRRIELGLADRRYTETTPIQSVTIPAVLEGVDLIGCAETGTGKTAAFLLPIMQRLLAPERPDAAGTRVLILAPTRELAVQIEDEFQGLAYHTSLSVAAVYGGVPSGPQERALVAGADVVVATPGRLLDHMSSGSSRFDGLEVLVLDEADRLLDMGFWPDVRKIVSALPATRQTLFFSATMSADVFKSAKEIMRAPKLVQVGRQTMPETISHVGAEVPSEEKAGWLARFLRENGEPAIVFVRTKRGADRLASRLASAGIRCVALHADRTQAERTSAVEGFKSGRYKALVATDVAARGLDIEGVAHVVNYEVPTSADAYVHRVGRTGRAHASGTALTLVDAAEKATLKALEQSLDLSLTRS
ncbi:MAG: rhlE 2 [Acidobacteria bacterium]|nr:rhlE 2 [Acidobacteriota bacterium]